MNEEFSDIQVTFLHKDFDNLQSLYGAEELNSIYGAGCIRNPKVMFIFMNPTGKNVASVKTWQGLRAQWLGTKNIWKLFYKINVLKEADYTKIMSFKAKDWNYDFSLKLYQNLSKKKACITNLGKCTQIDARPLPNKVFKEYLELLEKEIDFIKPNIIITFGNQVSSIILEKNISVSKDRGKYYIKKINHSDYKIYPVYYPVGQGMRNMDIAVEDILKIMKDN